MEAVPANESVYGVKTGVTEESHSKVEIADIAIRGVQFTASFVPQTSAPESRFLLNVFVGAGQEPVARPAGQIANIYGHAVRVEARGPSGQPLHRVQRRENAANHK